jgi:polysaccharide deacetylase family protein (PEP-CTERM system associated)
MDGGPKHADPADPASPADARVHMLSVDVEEYFQVEAAAACVRPDQWDSIPSRLGPPLDRILELLAAAGASATFFILGWVARRDPALVRRIADAGHEVASHGTSHRMVGGLAPADFRKDVEDSRALLQDVSGRPVVGYRAPTFSITRRTAWAIDVLAEAGYRYDSSVFPIRHDRYGVPGAPRFIHRARGPAGGTLIEVPPLTLRLGSVNWPVGGGGYLRLLPVRVVAAALRQAERAGRPGMLYLHPWELDPDQPVLPMGRLGRWRHRVGLRRTADKLSWLLARFRFSAAAPRLDAPAGQAVETYAY